MKVLAKLLNLYEQSKPKRAGIDPLAFVAETAKIGKDVYIAPFACIGEYAEVGDNTMIHPHATIGSGAKIGNDCILYANATIYHDCRIGNHCILHSGCVIGADGFGFAPTPEGYEKIPQIGIVILEDNVEIGANTCVDRATMGATIVHRGVKLDNLIQVAHNDEIGCTYRYGGASGYSRFYQSRRMVYVRRPGRHCRTYPYWKQSEPRSTVWCSQQY